MTLLDKARAGQSALEQIANMMVHEPYPGFEGKYFSMPCRNVVPKPVQKPHPPLWVACSNRETIHLAARLGLGALTFAFIDPAEARKWVQRNGPLALALVAARPSATLVLKLHPGDGRWEEVGAMVRDAGPQRSRIRVARREPLLPLLAWADALLVHRSTVAIEALAAGTPVLVGAVGSPSPDDALPVELQLPQVHDVAGLSAELDAVAGPPGRTAYLAAREAALELSIGPLDGQAAARIARYLLDSP